MLCALLLTINLSHREGKGWFRTADKSKRIFSLSQGGNPTLCIDSRSSLLSLNRSAELWRNGPAGNYFHEGEKKMTSGYWSQMARPNLQK